MKNIYLFFLLAFSVVVSAQDASNRLSKDSQEISEFKLYPNPAFDNTVYITTKDNATKDITIYNVFGKVVLTDRITAKALNIASLTPGIYLVQVIENKKSITRKLVVK